MTKTSERPTTPSGGARRRFLPIVQQEGVILDAGAKLFLKRGYEGVSIDAIVAEVGGSKRDIYRLFDSKEALFRAAIGRLARARVELISVLPGEGELRPMLVALGITLLNILLAPETLELHRLIVAEAVRVPESAMTFLENGPFAAYGVVEKLLSGSAGVKATGLTDPKATAVIFVDALAGDLLMRALLGQTVTAAEIAAKVEFVVSRLIDARPVPSV